MLSNLRIWLRVLMGSASLIFICNCIAGDDTTLVIDQNGTPLSDVSVRLLKPSALQMPPSEEQYTTIAATGSDGLFHADPVTTPGLMILISKEQFSMVVLDAQQPLPASIKLRDQAEIGGWVADEKGTTIAGAIIGPVRRMLTDDRGDARDVPPPEPLQAPVFGQSDSTGFFRIGGLPPGHYSFPIHAPSFSPRLDEAATGIVTTVTLSTEGTTWSGVLLGSRDQKPQAGMIVEAASGFLRLYCTTDSDGRFTFPLLQGDDWQFNTSTSPLLSGQTARIEHKEKGDAGYNLILLGNQGVSLAGQIRNAETSEPISNMILKLTTFWGTDEITTTTGADGSFRFDGVRAFGSFSLGFDDVGYTYRSNELGRLVEKVPLSTESGSDITTISLSLIPRIVVKGRVVGPNDRPVPSANVVLRTSKEVDQGYDELRRRSTFKATTDSKGRFAVGVLPSGTYEVNASAGRLASGLSQIEAYSTSSKELIIPVKPIASLRGRTLDSDSAPLADSWIEVADISNDTGTTSALPPKRIIQSARSDKQGSFLVEGVFPDHIRVTASNDMFDDVVTTELSADVSDNTPFDLQFPAGKVFTAQVLDPGGKPVKNADVQVFPRTDSSQSSSARLMMRQTDEEGRVTFHANTQGLERVVARHPDFAPFTSGAIPLPSENYEIRLKPFPTIAVTLTAPPTIRQENLQPMVLLLRAYQLGDSASETEPQASHFISIQQKPAADGKVQFENQEPGWYKAATATGNESMLYSESKAVRVLPDSGKIQVDLPLAAGASLTGRVTDEESGEPVPGADIHVQLQSGSAMDFELIAKPTDADGRYSIEVLPTASLLLTASHAGYSDKSQFISTPTSGHVEVDVKLGHSTTVVKGRVTLDGKPLPDAAVVVYKNEDMGKWLGSAVTGANGSYSIEGVPEGTRVVQVDALWGSSEKALSRTERVVVQGSGATADIAFRGLVRVSGRLRIEPADVDPQHPLTLYFTSLNSYGNTRPVAVDAEGDYEVYLEPGPYKVGLNEGADVLMDVPQDSAEFTANFRYEDLKAARVEASDSGKAN